jgi:diguanylate cyclase (GGDEF)-like protein
MMLDMRQAKRDFITLFYMREELVPTMRALEREFAASQKPYSLLMIDIDHFKSINDRYGHLHGDEVLQYFSSSLRLEFEGLEYYPFRYGGDEFAVLFGGKKSIEALFFADRFQRTIKKRMFLKKGRRFHITFSGGLATFPENAKTPELLLEKADQALYYSKYNGRGRTTVYGKIWLKRVMRIAVIVFMVISMTASYTIFWQDVILLKNRVLQKIGFDEFNLKANENMSLIRLKNGHSLRGKIAYESPLEVCLKVGGSENLKIIKKSEIKNIAYAKKAS